MATQSQQSPSFQDIGVAFCSQYYKMFAEHGKEAVIPFYHRTALMTFHQHQGNGSDEITVILRDRCQFKTIKHRPSNIDCHPLLDGGIVVMVTGSLLTDDDQHPLNYSQTFILRQESGSFYIFHDIFRLILADS